MRVLIQFERKPLLFSDPEYIISCLDPDDISGSFKKIEKALDDGYYLAGFFSYEAGYCFEERLKEKKSPDFPLVYLGAYRKPVLATMPFERRGSSDIPFDIRLNITQDEYALDIDAIRDHIAKGDVYQITYCLKLLFSFAGFARDAYSLYRRLLREQPVPYPAYIDAGEFKILSLSPELFIKKQGVRVLTKPMKGTWRRGGDPVSDLVARFRLKYDLKNRAENVMIADLLRNDLGRVGHGIRAPRLFEVAGYKTLYQMTSTVTGNVIKDIPIYDIFSSLFPSGSVTGAPKIRAMGIIRSLENEDRRIYTGAIGYITPGRDLFFNVPIRTILVRDGRGEMGIGGGIVWDSTPQGEWEEGMLKASFLAGPKWSDRQAWALGEILSCLKDNRHAIITNKS